MRQNQRKNQQFNDKQIIQPVDTENFNTLNVIKVDHKTMQRQKEIINVISDMTLQMS